ncbi:3-hydroxyacyl-ACP dehydratase FabZ family protein [Streptomyces fimicarius]|uniref:3-hydroxyacyl-ACP dehydratase FabZ family protein n=1 Tax=Streptomyces caviscabies TaxID=90079 RepID=A0ABW2MPY8_9ACTN|nr:MULTISPECIES: beta-hydroxyacyl-ACP dehydratase [unclassified Streptomyces]MDX3500813.1 beta-hydroxyacyl-ACP dehydratase [Streptomyces sp. ATCC51928]MDX3591484.1 beta-hydroxyacyl-ACP dehydratase [Streptomyces sp. ID03-2B]MDX5520874.1 beta-hydroxyacyl-ACP dehydratase [Streptomyces sp. DE06-01C]
MIGSAELRGLLPHRHPMLLLDRVEELKAGERLVARKAVTNNEPWYADLPQDTPPDGYRYPEVLLTESWCQAAGVLATWDQPNPDVLSGRVMLFGGVSDVRFERPVLPGDVVVHHVRVLRVLPDTMIFEGEALVDGERVMTVERATLAFRPATALTEAVRAS